MKNDAMRNVCLAVLAAFGAVRTASGVVEDVTGRKPAFSVRFAERQFVANGVSVASDAAGEWRDVTELQADDFIDRDSDHCFRLEPYAGSYPHPELAVQNTVSGRNGLTFSLTGYRRSGAGVIAAFDFNTASGHWVLTIENGDSDLKPILVRKYTAAGAGTTLLTFSGAAIGEGARVNAIMTWCSETLYFHVNGMSAGTVANFEPCRDTVSLGTLRLGALPSDFEDLDLRTSSCAAFDISDIRCYDLSLSEEECRLLHAQETGATVQVSLVETAWHSPALVYTNATFRVGAALGDFVSRRPAEDGLAFLGWVRESDPSTLVTADTLAASLTDFRLVAKWTNIVYRITYDYRGFPFATNETYEIVRGEKYRLPPLADIFTNQLKGQFLGWQAGDGYLSSSDAFPRSGTCGDETYGAAYSFRDAILRFDFGTGEEPIVTNAYIDCYYATFFPSQQPTREGFRFVGWGYEDGTPLAEGETIWDTDETLLALWEGLAQTVVWEIYDGSSTVTTDSRTGGLYNLPDNPPVCDLDDGRTRKFYAWVQPSDDGWREIASWDWEEMEWDIDEEMTVLPCAHTNSASWWFSCALDPAGGSLAAAGTTQTWFRIQARADDWASLPEPDRFGYRFDGWWDGANRVTDESEVGTNATDLISGEGLPLLLVARWQAEKVNVVLHLGDENDSTQETTLDYNSEFAALPEVTRPGFALEGWHYSHENGLSVAVTSRVETLTTIDLFAKWTNATYRVDYRILDTILDGESIRVTHNGTWPELLDPSSVPGLVPVGSEFTGWRLNAADGLLVRTGDTASELVTNSVLVATFAGVPCDITLDPNGGSLDVDSRTITVRYGEAIGGLPTAVSRGGCAFQGWYGADGRRYQNGDRWTGTAGLVLFARWVGTNDITLSYCATASDAEKPSAVVTNRYNLPMSPTGPAAPARTVEGDTVAFLGWYVGSRQVYDANNRLVDDFTNGCPYETSQTLVAHWSIGRDMFAGAYELTAGATNRVVGYEATDEVGEEEHSESNLRATHWYRFVGRAKDVVTIRFEDLTADPSFFALALYSGTALTNLTPVANGEFEQEGEFTVTLPRTDSYRLVVAQHTEGAALSAYELTVSGFLGVQPSRITFDPNGGEIPQGEETLSLNTGDTLADLPVPYRQACDFLGWEGPNGRYYAKGDVWDLAGERTLKAVWIGSSDIMLTFRSSTADGKWNETNQTARYGLAMGGTCPAAEPRDSERDGAQFLGWYDGTNQVYDADNRLLPAYTNGCPYLTDVTLDAHWRGGRDFFAGAYEISSSTVYRVFGYEGTREEGEPDHSASKLGATHWYRFLGTAGDVVRVRFGEDSWLIDNPKVALALYEGETLASLELVKSVETVPEVLTDTLVVTLPHSGEFRLAVAEDAAGPALKDYNLEVLDFTTPRRCEITLDLNEGTAEGADLTLVAYKGGILRGLPVPVRSGYIFVGWEDANGVRHVNGEIWEGDGDCELSAVWGGDLTLTFLSCRTDGESHESRVEARYGQPMAETCEAAPSRVAGRDDAQFLGWYDGTNQVYDADNRLCPAYTNGCPYLLDQTLVARWRGGRDSFAGAYDLEDGTGEYRSLDVIGYEGTREEGEPQHTASNLGSTHWYRFLGTRGNTVRIRVADQTGVVNPTVALALYRGETLSSLVAVTNVETRTGEAVLEMTLPVSDEYRIAVVEAAEESGGPALQYYEILANGFQKPETCTITLDPNGATNVVEQQMTVYDGGFLRNLPTPVRPGYAFAGWQERFSEMIYANGDIYEPDHTETSFTAVWEGETDITLTFVSSTTDGVLESTNVTTRYNRVLDTYGPVPTPRVAERDGAEFLGWYAYGGSDELYNGANKSCYTRCPYTTNQTLVARWAGGRDEFSGAYGLSTNVTCRVLGYWGGEHWYRITGSAHDTIRATVRTFNDSAEARESSVRLSLYEGTELSNLHWLAQTEFDETSGTLEAELETSGEYFLYVDSSAARLLDYEISLSAGSAPSPVVEDYQPYPACRIGACSWSWGTNEVTILDQMDLSGAKCLHLAIDLDRTEEYLVALTNSIATNGYTVTATKFVLPGEDWTSRETVSNTCGLVRATDSEASTDEEPGEMKETEEWEEKILNPIALAAEQTAFIGASKMSINVGYLMQPVIVGGEDMNANGAIGFDRLNRVIGVCESYGVQILLETGLERADETLAMLAAYEAYHYMDEGTVRVCFDPADHLIFGGEDPCAVFDKLQSRIDLVHIRDTFASEDARREASGSFAGDVKWGTGDVSVQHGFLSHVRERQWVGYSFVERTSGTNRVADVRETLQLMLLANNTNVQSKWISTSSMVGETELARREAVLKTSGFSRATSVRMAETNRYVALQTWTEDTTKHAGTTLAPTELSKARYPITQAAYNLAESPKEVVMAMLKCDPVFGSTEGEACLEFKIASDFAANVKAENVTLLEAAISVEGSTSLDGSWSADSLTYEIDSINRTTGVVGITAKPKPVDGKVPKQFFFRGVAY